MDGLVICQQCDRVGHFARAWPANLPLPRAPTRYQNYRHNYISAATSQYPRPLYTPNQHSQRTSYRPNDNRHDTMWYPYPQDAIYTNPSRRPPFPSADQTDNKCQARRSNIPGQQHNYSNVTQNHALQDRQCLISGSLDNKPITILIDTGSSISLMDEQLYYSLSLVPPLQPTSFSVSRADDKPLIALSKTAISIAISDATFRVQIVVTKNILFPTILGIDFLRTHGGVINFPTNQLYLTNPPPKLADSSINTIHMHNTHTTHAHTQHIPPTLTHLCPTQPTLSYK